MSRNITLSFLFYLRKNKLNKDGEAPIYLRITVDGERTNISTNRSIKPDRWNDIADKVKGSNEESKSLNHYLESFKNKVYEHHSRLVEKGKLITAESLRNAVLGIGEETYSLIQTFEYHNQQMKEKVGKDFALATATRYNPRSEISEGFI